MKYLLAVLTVVRALLPVAGNAFQCSSTPVSFNSYDVFSAAPTYSTGTVSVSCNNPNQQAMPVTIAINGGRSGTFNPRQMRATLGADSLDYYLFTTAARTVIWGDGTGGSSTVTNIVSKSAPWNAPIYGSLPPRQNVSAGSYADAVVVTVTW